MNIAAYIDHTALKPGTTQAEIQQLCREAIAQQFAAVCVPPYYISAARELLQGSAVKLATVIGFPLGYTLLSSKMQEIKDAINNGADELDIVHNIAALKNDDWDYLKNEVKTCTELVHRSGKTIKVIVESGILNEVELIKCCELYAALGIDFMKTSTGYAEKGATVEAVQTMRKYLPESIAVKASGGIRTFAFAKELIDAGAARIGCSAGMQIIKESSALNLQA